MIAVLRETGSNRYTLNTLAALLEDCGVPWEAVGTFGAVVGRVLAGASRGRPVLALYSFMTPHLDDVAREVRALRSAAPGVRLLAGGPHPTADPEGTLALGFDHVFVGEAERTLPEFLRLGAEGAPVILDPDGGPPDLDRYPPFAGPRFGPVEVTRGCRFRCGFCAVGGRTVRHRSPAAVLAAAERLRASGRRRIVFVTPDALAYGGSVAALEALLADLRAVGARPSAGSFPSEVRPDRVTPEAVEVLARHCENRTLVIGAQSGDDAVLRRLGRGHTVDDVLRAARVARKGGFTPHVDLIFGLPGETPAEQRATIGLATVLRRESDARLHVHYFHPLPGTPLWGSDPSGLSDEARGFLGDLRASGAEDGCWPEQERWAWQIVEWSRQGLIRTPRGTAWSDRSAARG